MPDHTIYSTGGSELVARKDGKMLSFVTVEPDLRNPSVTKDRIHITMSMTVFDKVAAWLKEQE